MSSSNQVPSDNTSTTSSHSTKKRSKGHSALPLVKRDKEEMVVMFNPMNDPQTPFPRIFGEEKDADSFM